MNSIIPYLFPQMDAKTFHLTKKRNLWVFLTPNRFDFWASFWNLKSLSFSLELDLAVQSINHENVFQKKTERIILIQKTKQVKYRCTELKSIDQHANILIYKPFKLSPFLLLSFIFPHLAAGCSINIARQSCSSRTRFLFTSGLMSTATITRCLSSLRMRL